jgi:hypothetical protein
MIAQLRLGQAALVEAKVVDLAGLEGVGGVLVAADPVVRRVS